MRQLNVVARFFGWTARKTFVKQALVNMVFTLGV
jgi:hypothetical protein